jgi:ABC-type glycerol-3-phosphate transport system permease component
MFVLVDEDAAAPPALPPSSPDAPDASAVSRRRWPWSTLTGHVVLAVIGLACVFPIYWMYATSVRPAGDVFDQSLIPGAFSLDNYRHVIDMIPLGKMMAGTLGMAVAVALGTVLTSLLAAYAFARWDFPGKRLVFFLVVATWLVPAQATMLPNYVLISQLGWLNTVTAVVVPQLVSATSVLLLFQHISSFPRELLDAARIDGRSGWNTLWTVLVPNLRPALAAVVVLSFISAWNEYFWPTVVMRQTDSLIQVGIRSFLTSEGNDWGALMAASGLACLPVFAIYLVLQRQVIDAFVRSGLR